MDDYKRKVIKRLEYMIAREKKIIAKNNLVDNSIDYYLDGKVAGLYAALNNIKWGV